MDFAQVCEEIHWESMQLPRNGNPPRFVGGSVHLVFAFLFYFGDELVFWFLWFLGGRWFRKLTECLFVLRNSLRYAGFWSYQCVWKYGVETRCDYLLLVRMQSIYVNWELELLAVTVWRSVALSNCLMYCYQSHCYDSFWAFQIFFQIKSNFPLNINVNLLLFLQSLCGENHPTKRKIICLYLCIISMTSSHYQVIVISYHDAFKNKLC